MLKWLLKWFSAHPMAHVPDITVERAAEIKTLYERGEITQKELGAMFGVHQSQISRILSKRCSTATVEASTTSPRSGHASPLPSPAKRRARPADPGGNARPSWNSCCCR